MNARQKAKHYKKKYNELYVYAMTALNSARELTREHLVRIIDIGAEERFPRMDTGGPSEEAIIEELLHSLTQTDEFKQSVAVEQYSDPLTDEMVYRAHLQTLRPKMEE